MTETIFDRLSGYFGTGNGAFSAAVAQHTVKHGSGVWRPESEFDVHSLMVMNMPQLGTSVPGPKRLLFAHLESLLVTTVGEGSTSFCRFERCVVGDPKVLLKLFSPSFV